MAGISLSVRKRIHTAEDFIVAARGLSEIMTTTTNRIYRDFAEIRAIYVHERLFNAQSF
jgi:hypothetical protein